MGNSLFILCAIALLGAFGGGLASALVTYYLGKRNERILIANEEKRNRLAIELEKQRALQQQKLEEFRDKRQNAKDLLLILSKIADKVLEADKNSVVVSAQMTLPNMQKEINAFGALVEKIEYLWEQNGFLLDANLGNSIQKIFRLMFLYRDCAMRCTTFAMIAGQQNQIKPIISNCNYYRKLWNVEWDKINDQMRKIKNSLF
jgi:hypothetical protein